LLLLEEFFSKGRIEGSTLRRLRFSSRALGRRLNFTIRQKGIQVILADSVLRTKSIADIDSLQLASANPAEHFIR
jgi:hypothetical protein